ncbi:ABC transporter substrate-binding protein [Cohnella thailandensis]|nr:ABC transporter substrate-binding protein [Cohnella thailandensis]MBP1973647.1 polar amino acid transport system substrate-binding protein [Cohnella thailandensis]
MKKNKRALIGMATAAAILLLSACGSNNNNNAGSGAVASPSASAPASQAAAVAPPANLVTSGVLTYGTAATFPPYEYMKDEKYTGFDIELGEAIAAQMGLQVKIEAMNFEGLIPALQGKRIDIINSAMYIKPEREEQVDFVPYMHIGRSIVVKAGNAKNIHSIDDLSGKTVAVTRGAVEEIYANEQNELFKSQNKDLIKILALPTANDAVLATQQGRADAVLHSTPGAAYLLEEMPGEFEIVNSINSDTQIGIAIQKGDVNAELKAAIEEALNNLVADGTYDKLMEKYNLPAEMSLFNE